MAAAGLLVAALAPDGGRHRATSGCLASRKPCVAQAQALQIRSTKILRLPRSKELRGRLIDGGGGRSKEHRWGETKGDTKETQLMLLRATTYYTCNARGAARRLRALSNCSPPSFSLSRWRGPRLFPAGDALSAFTLVQDRLCPAFSTWSPCLSVSHLCHHSSIPCGLRPPRPQTRLSK